MSKLLEMMKKSENEINEMFDSGMFNELAIGYALIALKLLKTDKSFLEPFEECIKRAFSDYDAATARRIYNNS